MVKNTVPGAENLPVDGLPGAENLPLDGLPGAEDLPGLDNLPGADDLPTPPVTGGSNNQINAPISIPVNVCGNAVGVLGDASASCKGGATVKNSGSGSSNKTSGEGGIGSGNQVNAPISVPVNVCGNAIGVLGDAKAKCKGGATVKNSGSGGNKTSGEGGIASGNQVNAPISVPVNVCGNAIAIAGEAKAMCKGGATVDNNGGYGASGNTTSGEGGIGSGNQVNAPLSIPVTVCGNAAGGFEAKAKCKGGATVKNNGTGSNNTTSGEGGILSGNQVDAPVEAPVNVCGNAVAALGDAAAACAGTVSAGTAGSGVSAQSAQGGVQSAAADTGGGLLSGNNVSLPLSLPVNACANSVSVLGSASSGCGGGSVAPPDDDDNPPAADPPDDGDDGEVPPPDDGDDTHPRPGPDEGNAGGQLPYTGLNLGSLLVLALGALAAGGACVMATARRRPRVSRG